jgi:hypothetical protein
MVGGFEGSNTRFADQACLYLSSMKVGIYLKWFITRSQAQGEQCHRVRSQHTTDLLTCSQCFALLRHELGRSNRSIHP